MLEAIRRDHPLSLHGVCMSIGGPQPLDQMHLTRFRKDARRELGAPGAPALAAETEQLRTRWVEQRMVDAGRSRANDPDRAGGGGTAHAALAGPGGDDPGPHELLPLPIAG